MVYAFEDKIKSRYKSCIDIIGHLEREGRNNYYFFHQFISAIIQ